MGEDIELKKRLDKSKENIRRCKESIRHYN